jgi:hypothetical protein
MAASLAMRPRLLSVSRRRAEFPYDAYDLGRAADDRPFGGALSRTTLPLDSLHCGISVALELIGSVLERTTLHLPLMLTFSPASAATVM